MTSYLAAVNVQGGLQQLAALVASALVVIVGVSLMGHLLRRSSLGIVVGIIAGAVVYLVVSGNLLPDVGDTLKNIFQIQ